MTFHTTALGRDVPADDWAAIQCDAALALLLEFARSPFNDTTLFMPTDSLCNALGIGQDELFISIAPAIRDGRLIMLSHTAPDGGRARLSIAGIADTSFRKRVAELWAAR